MLAPAVAERARLLETAAEERVFANAPLIVGLVLGVVRLRLARIKISGNLCGPPSDARRGRTPPNTKAGTPYLFSSAAIAGASTSLTPRARTSGCRCEMWQLIITRAGCSLPAGAKAHQLTAPAAHDERRQRQDDAYSEPHWQPVSKGSEAG